MQAESSGKFDGSQYVVLEANTFESHAPGPEPVTLP